MFNAHVFTYYTLPWGQVVFKCLTVRRSDPRGSRHIYGHTPRRHALSLSLGLSLWQSSLALSIMYFTHTDGRTIGRCDEQVTKHTAAAAMRARSRHAPYP